MLSDQKKEKKNTYNLIVNVQFNQTFYKHVKNNKVYLFWRRRRVAHYYLNEVTSKSKNLKFLQIIFLFLKTMFEICFLFAKFYTFVKGKNKNSERIDKTNVR